MRLLDPQVVTRLPLPRTDRADVSIVVPLDSAHALPRPVVIEARFEQASVRKAVTLEPGRSEVRLEPEEFPQLRLSQPRLWWPNGYGPANLYTLALAVLDDGTESDTRTLRFGVRHITYELSLFDEAGRLRRVEVDPAAATVRGEPLIDVRHEAIKKTPHGWAASLTPAGESSPAVRAIASESLSPHLAIRVNGVRNRSARRKLGHGRLAQADRARATGALLSPAPRRQSQHRFATGWDRTPRTSFYELADEYGLLILNDFWASTQDFQVEPQDPALFLANARDMILRYRNHPSIVLWFGRNEGVPQPILNEGLDELVATLDGTRYFTGSSNNVNLQGSGPYNYRPPHQYFTELAQGFSVEMGTPSLSTLESLHASIPEADRWPLSDTIAYHDWHFGGNGDVATFMTSLATQFGAATSLEDFERKAQMMNFVTYRALFEGFHAHLWTRNSGRLLWMTHPSWPSNAWQIYSSDYDTHAAYYGVKKACEPIHAQMNLPDHRLAVVNTTRTDRPGLKLRSRILSLDGRSLADRTQNLDAAANAVTRRDALALESHLAQEGMVLVALLLTDAAGNRLSENIYWQGLDEASHQRLNAMPRQPIAMNVRTSRQGDETVLDVELQNQGSAPALAAKLTIFDNRGARILPAFYSDNYVSLLPREPRRIEIRYRARADAPAQLKLRGWNVEPATAVVSR